MLLDNWPWIAGIAGLVIAVVVALSLRWRQRQPDSDWALRSVAIDGLHGVLVPDGMGGHIQIEHLLLTVRGILIVDVKRYDGVIFASDRMDEWTVITKNGRHAFPNPQSSLYDRIAAVRQLLRGVPVSGHVLFSAGADFSKGRPKDVILPAELNEQYKKPDASETERLTEAFWPHWDRLRESVQPASAV